MTASGKKKILLLSVSAGNGHVRAAEGLAAGLAHWFPGHEARHVDLMTLVPTLFRKAYKDAYIKLVQKHPALWGYIYSSTDKAQAESALSRLRRSIESACNKPLRRIIEEFDPDHIVCTHFMPLQVLARWRTKGRITQPVWTCITDFVSHRFWVEPHQAGYFAASEEDVRRLRRRGLGESLIVPSGIPVLPAFIPSGDQVAARKAGAERFALDPAKQIVLLMGGGAGVGDLLHTTESLIGLGGDFQLVVLAGRNQTLLKKLAATAAAVPGRLFPQGFTDEVPALLAASDFVISKPGGLTTVECLAMGKPMIAYGAIPGQEEHNADFLLENGAALKAPDIAGLLWRAERLLKEPALLSRLSANAAAAGKPYAARDILETVLGEKAAPRPEDAG